MEPVAPAPGFEPLMAPPEPQPEVPAAAPEPAAEPAPLVPLSFPPPPAPEPEPKPEPVEPVHLPEFAPITLTPPAPAPLEPPAAETPAETPAPLPVIDPFPTAPLADPAPIEQPMIGSIGHSRGAYRVVVRLNDADGVEVGVFEDFGTAMAGAQEVIEQFSNTDGSWPFYAGRFIRPDLIVSVDVVDA